jgi:uncharacterized protein
MTANSCRLCGGQLSAGIRELLASGWVRRWTAGVALAGVLQFAGCTNRGATPVEPGRAGAIHEEEVRFASGNVSLGGTLVLPGGSQRHPAVVLFHGSGPQSRDLFTARWFAAQGIAALAYDKRGVGESSGNFRTGPFMDLCDDGLAGIRYLKARKEIDSKRIGVWGQSQGGWLGPLAASRSADISWVIAVSGPGVSPGDQMLFYYEEELRARGVPEEDVLEANALRRDVWNYLFTGQEYEHARDELSRARHKRWYGKVKTEEDDLFGPLETPAELSRPNLVRFRREMTYNPVPALRALRVPALFLFGDEDRLVPVGKSVEVIRRVLTESRNLDFTIQVFHGADHGMHLADSYGVDPEYQETMRKWLATRVGASR